MATSRRPSPKPKRPARGASRASGASRPTRAARPTRAGDKRRAADLLPATSQLARLLVEEVRDYAIFVIDLDNKIRFWNPGAEAILGYRAREIVGKSAAVIFTPEDRAAGQVEKELKRAARTGRAEDDRWQLRKGGKRFWAS